ncbi:hypothetical protein HPB49_007644 [Dermacentor silvarum]|uniref:Uncharacterized protein n=1 Tax=Dermacentor silvarum TaxID=543639 RepID=A0ACB8CW08_DERSI|nr:hypothetical protein HPB49_007644 [Dermacentor silvarum]
MVGSGTAGFVVSKTGGTVEPGTGKRLDDTSCARDKERPASNFAPTARQGSSAAVHGTPNCALDRGRPASELAPTAEQEGCNAVYSSEKGAQDKALHAKQMEVLRVLQDIEVLEEDRENAETQCRQLVATAVRLCSRERHVLSHPRAQSWYEETLPHFPDSVFRESFRLNRCTFRYIVSVCKSLARQDANMRQAIPLEKRVAIGLYRLATSAEDRTVANLFGVSRSSVNIIFREFCSVVVRRLEPRYVRFPSAQGLAEHLHQFTAVAGFPQGIGALDGCHI